MSGRAESRPCEKVANTNYIEMLRQAQHDT